MVEPIANAAPGRGMNEVANFLVAGQIVIGNPTSAGARAALIRADWYSDSCPARIIWAASQAICRRSFSLGMVGLKQDCASLFKRVDQLLISFLSWFTARQSGFWRLRQLRSLMTRLKEFDFLSC